MFYSDPPDHLQTRYHCRSPRCTGKLETPTDNLRDAFCCSDRFPGAPTIDLGSTRALSEDSQERVR